MVARSREEIFKERTGDTESAAEEDSNHGGKPWNGPNTEEPEQVTDPHRVLFLHIIEQAIRDARGSGISSFSSGSSATAAELDRTSAVTFLTAESGPWARWREEVLAFAGIEPDSFARLIERERHTWPPVKSGSANERRRERAQQAQVVEATPAPTAKPVIEPLPAESFHRRSLLVGTGISFPTFK